MDLRSNDPFWLLKNGYISNYPGLCANIKTDIVVMGAGISGSLMAWHLCNAGYKVVLVEKRHAGMGSTAASTALLQYEIDTPLLQLCRLVGEKTRWKVTVFVLGQSLTSNKFAGPFRAGQISGSGKVSNTLRLKKTSMNCTKNTG